jgi:PAS domain S-box-containing protein
VILALAALYVLTARLGLMLALPPEKKATAVWPPSGIALAALLLFGPRLWPGVWIGAFLANLWDALDPANPNPLASHLMVSAGIATGSTFQALAGCFLLRRWVGSCHPFDRASHAFLFAGAALLMCLVAATFGALSLYLGGFAPLSALGFIWWTWWLGDMTGVLTVGSLLLAWSRAPGFLREPRRLAEAALLVVLLLTLGSAIFEIISPVLDLPPPLAYLTVPFLVWATFRFGLHGAATSLFLLSALAVAGTALGKGPFAQPTVQGSLLLLQVFMGVIAVTALVMAAVLSERRGAEEKVRRWEHLSAHAGWPVAVVNPIDNTLQVVNQAFAEMHGYAVEELVGRPLADVLAAECQGELSGHALAIHEKGDHVYESVHLRKDGSRFPCLTHGTAFKDTHGEVQFRAGTFKDITELKQAEALRQENESRMRSVVNHVIDGIVTINESGIVESFNLAAERLFGYSAAEVIGQNVRMLMPEPYRSGHDGYLANYLRSGQAKIIGIGREVVGRRKDGSTFPMDLAVSEFRLGERRCFTGIVRDITERKQAEAVVQRHQQELEERIRERTAELEEEVRERNKTNTTLQAVLNAFPDLFFRLDADGTILAYNASRASDLYVPPEEFLGRRVQDALSPEVGRLFHDAIEEVHRTSGLVSIEYALTLADGERYFEARLLPLLERQVKVIVRDITPRKRAEAELQQAKDAAVAANRAKSEFLANMSHEIRTPMNGILGMTELALDTDLSPRQREYMSTVKQSAESLLTIINDILDFSKIEAGRLDLDPQPFGLREILGEMLKPLALRAFKKGLRLAHHVQPELPELLVGDPGRLRQVVINLVGNAIKFTHQGEVIVRVQSAECRVQNERQQAEAGVSESSSSTLHSALCTLHFAVSDTGIGIPTDKLDAIFAPFVQADGSMARRFGGTGLGLSISSRLVEMMGGRIRVESEHGRGSTFHFTVRMGLQRGAAAPEPVTVRRPADLMPARGLRILLAEDNLINQMVSVGALQKEGHTVSVVSNGKEALAALEVQAFDVVLMDVQMPEMDGLEATAAIRQREKETGRDVPVIALTAHAMKGDRERCLRAGMDGYVTKPIRSEELRQALTRHARPPAGARGSPRVNPPANREALDKATLLARVGGDVRLLRQILGLFPRECARLMGELHEAVARGDAARVKRAAHTLKGTLGNLSAADAYEAALRVEELGHGGDLASVGEAFGSLQHHVQRVNLAVAEVTGSLTS